MMSGTLSWVSGNLNNRGTYGGFWASTPNSYTYSRYLVFYSSNVYPKSNDNKPHGYTLRCVARPKFPPLFYLNRVSEVRSALKIFLSGNVSSRALRSLPLSVMLSGNLSWVAGNLYNRGTSGYFWASTPTSYTNSRLLYFYSTNVSPKNNSDKPGGFTLRCVACIFRLCYNSFRNPCAERSRKFYFRI